MKRYLITMAILLLAALCAGVAVWLLYQDLNATTLIEESAQEGNTEATMDGVPPPADSSDESSSGRSIPDEPVTITAESLTDTQRKMLKTFGFDKPEYTITEAMIECARGKVGDARLEEVLNGAAPTPLEAMSLVPCMKK